jgi:hypothetical protein
MCDNNEECNVWELIISEQRTKDVIEWHKREKHDN